LSGSPVQPYAILLSVGGHPALLFLDFEIALCKPQNESRSADAKCVVYIPGQVNLRLSGGETNGVPLNQSVTTIRRLKTSISAHLHLAFLDCIDHPTAAMVVGTPIDLRLLGVTKKHKTVFRIAIKLLRGRTLPEQRSEPILAGRSGDKSLEIAAALFN